MLPDLAHPEPSVLPGLLMVDARQYSAENHRRLSGLSLRAFLAVADLWGLAL